MYEKSIEGFRHVNMTRDRSTDVSVEVELKVTENYTGLCVILLDTL